MQIRTFYGSKSIGVFLLYDSGDEKAPVCGIWCFYHNLNTLVDFWTLAPLLLLFYGFKRQSFLICIDCNSKTTYVHLNATGNVFMFEVKSEAAFIVYIKKKNIFEYPISQRMAVKYWFIL